MKFHKRKFRKKAKNTLFLKSDIDELFETVVKIYRHILFIWLIYAVLFIS